MTNNPNNQDWREGLKCEITKREDRNANRRIKEELI